MTTAHSLPTTARFAPYPGRSLSARQRGARRSSGWRRAAPQLATWLIVASVLAAAGTRMAATARLNWATKEDAGPAGIFTQLPADPKLLPITQAPILAASKTATLTVDADGNGVPSPGDTLLYTVTISNSGNAASTGVLFTDIPDPRTTLITGSVQTDLGLVTSGNLLGNTTVAVTIGTLPAGAAASISLRVRIANPLPAGILAVVNQGIVASNELPPVLTDDPSRPGPADPTVTPVTSAPILTASKTATLAIDADGNGVPSPGDTLVYEITVTNSGNGGATGLLLTDLPDPRTTLVAGSVQSDLGTITHGNLPTDTTLAVSLGTLAAGTTATVSFRATIANPLPVGVVQVVNQGTLTSNELPPVLTDDPSRPGPADPTVTAVTAAPVLTASKTATLAIDADGNGVPSPGDTLLYEITVTNSGNGGATGLLLTDLPDPRTTLVTGSVQSDLGTIIHGNLPADTTLAVSLGTLPAGATATVSFRATIANPLPAGVVQVANQGTLTSNELPPVLTDDPSRPGPADPTITPVTTAPILTASKTATLVIDPDSDGIPAPGDTLLYTITVTNSGNGGATGVLLTDLPDPRTTLVTGSVQSDLGTIIHGNLPADTTLAVSLGTLPAGATATVSFRATIANPLPAGVVQVANQGTLTSNELPPVLTDDPSRPGPADPTITPVVAAPVLRASKTATLVIDPDSDGIPAPGDTLLYTITLENSGNSAATGVLLTDFLDPATALVAGSVQTDLGTITSGNLPGNSTVAVSLGTLPGGASATVSFRATIANPLPIGMVQVSNQGTVTSNELPALLTDDPSRPGPADATVTAVVAAPVLAASKTATLAVDADGNGMPSAGDTLLYTVTIANTGNQAATGVVLTDLLEPRLTLVGGSVQTELGTVSLGNLAGDTTVAVLLGTVPAGATAVVSFRARIAKPLPAGVVEVVNQGAVASNELPPVLTDDPTRPGLADPTVTPVTAAPVLAASKTATLVIDADGNGGPSPGDTILYTLAVTNAGNGAATGVLLTDILDRNTSLVAGSVQTSTGTVVINNLGGDPSVAVEIGTLPAGATVAISFRVRIADPLPAGVTVISNQATITSNELPAVFTVDPSRGPAPAPTVTAVTGAPLLSAAKTVTLAVDGDGNGTPSPGDTLLYTIRIVNGGNGTATEVLLSDDPDPNTALVAGSVQTDAGIVTLGNLPGATRVGITIGDLPAGGGTATASFRVRIANQLPAGARTVANQGTVTAAGLAPVLTDDPLTRARSDPTIIAVTSQPVLAATKQASLLDDLDGDGRPSPGDILLYAIELRNLGNAPATGVLFADTPDPRTQIVAASIRTSQGTVVHGNTSGAGQIIVDLGTVAAAGAGASISYEVRIANPFLGSPAAVTNQGVFTSNELPPLQTDDPATVATGDPTVTPVGAAVSAVPTLSSPALAALGLALAAAACLRFRQTRSAADRTGASHA